MYADKVKNYMIEGTRHFTDITFNGISSPLLKEQKNEKSHSVYLSIQTILAFVIKKHFKCPSVTSAKASGLQYTITSTFILTKSLILHLHQALLSKF